MRVLTLKPMEFRMPRPGTLAIGVLVLIASLFIIFPVFTIIVTSFRAGLPGEVSPATLENYREAFLDPFTWQVLQNTLLFALGTSGVILFFAVPTAWLIERTDVPAKQWWVTLMSLGIVIPTFLKAIAWILLLSPNIGIFNKLMVSSFGLDAAPFSIYNLWGMSFVQGIILVPPAFFMIAAAYKLMDPSLEEASFASGAGNLRTFLVINFPLTLPAIVAAALYLFITAIEVFEVPGLIGTPSRIFVFSTLIYYATHPEVGLPKYGLAGAYGMIVLVMAFGGSYLYYRVIRQSYRYAVVTGRGYRPKLIELGRLKALAVLFLLFFFALEIFLPFMTLLWASVVPYIQVPSAEAIAKITLANYLKVPDYAGLKPFVNTLLLMLSAPTLSVFLSLLISWVVIRSRSRGRYLLDGVAFLPHAVSSILFAVALSYLALAYGEFFPVYGTLIIIILANAIKYISFGTRTFNSALIQIHRELEEAAEVSGASNAKVLSTIIVPLLGPALLNGWLWISLLSFREVTMALTLISPKNVVLSTLVWNLWSAGYVPEAAALGVMMVFVLGGFVVLARKLGEKAIAAL